MQWNSRSAVANKNSLTHFLFENNIDIALLSETWFKKNQEYRFKGYNIIRRDRDDGYAGVAILIRSSLPFTELNITPNFSQDILVCGCTVNFNSMNISFLSIYRSPTAKTKITDWINLFSQFSAPIIIGGDMNAHNAAWGSHKNDNYGQQIISALSGLDLIILNNGAPTCLNRPGINHSIIDISLCSPDIVNKLSWSINPDTLGSNHFPIMMKFENALKTDNLIHPRSKWNVNKANWNLYSESIETMFENLPEFSDINEKYNYLLQKINEAASHSIPKFKPFKNKKHPPSPWWDGECDLEITRRREAIERYKQSSTTSNFIECQKLMAESKKFFKTKAKKCWVEWCSQLNKNTSSKDLWKKQKDFGNKTKAKKNLKRFLPQ
ncbi:hypothetical protein JTB14_021545 [Gonioctena quinquepunctata]|nr:hypothetical protein JTB14_021545 [Gonioctena quinquepunctata]